TGTGNHFLWPLLGMENRTDGYLYRFFPFFMISRTGETTELLVTPLYYQENSPRGTERFFLPFYGRYESDTVRKDFYAAATYIHTREKEPGGETVRERDDYLWGLGASEKDTRVKASHSHLLPIYWSTKTSPVDRSILGPFYYSHRIVDGD